MNPKNKKIFIEGKKVMFNKLNSLIDGLFIGETNRIAKENLQKIFYENKQVGKNGNLTNGIQELEQLEMIVKMFSDNLFEIYQKQDIVNKKEYLHTLKTRKEAINWINKNKYEINDAIITDTFNTSKLTSNIKDMKLRLGANEDMEILTRDSPKYFTEKINQFLENEKLYFETQFNNTDEETISATSENVTSPFDYFKLKTPIKQDNLPDVFNSLVKNKFIEDNKDSKKDFKNIFADISPKKRKVKQIKWIGTAGELSCFIKLLCFSKPPKVADMKNKHWYITLKYFEGKTVKHKPYDKAILRGAKDISDSRKKILEDIISTNF